VSKQQLAEDLAKTIAEVRTAATPTICSEAAEHLAQLTRKIDPKKVDDKAIADMVSLLDLPVGRYWVAVSLGNLGRRAKVAVPKLLELLPEEDCAHVDRSASGGIRWALKKMGIKPPPFPTCGTTRK
jgi:hypothetical protein